MMHLGWERSAIRNTAQEQGGERAEAVRDRDAARTAGAGPSRAGLRGSSTPRPGTPRKGRGRAAAPGQGCAVGTHGGSFATGKLRAAGGTQAAPQPVTPSPDELLLHFSSAPRVGAFPPFSTKLPRGAVPKRPGARPPSAGMEPGDGPEQRGAPAVPPPPAGPTCWRRSALSAARCGRPPAGAPGAAAVPSRRGGAAGCGPRSRRSSERSSR